MGSAIEPDDGRRRCDRLGHAGDHRALPAAEVGADPAAAPRPGAGRLRHQRRDGATSPSSSAHTPAEVLRHGDVLRDVQVRAGRQVPHQHLRHDVVRAAGRRRADAPRRGPPRHQGRRHHDRRAVHAASTPSARPRAPRRRACRSTTATATGSRTAQLDAADRRPAARARSTPRSRRTARSPRSASSIPADRGVGAVDPDDVTGPPAWMPDRPRRGGARA